MEPWKTDELKIMQVAIPDDGETPPGALDFTFAPNREFQLLKVAIKFSTTVTTSENFTATFASVNGAKFGYVMESDDMQGLTEKVYDYSAALEYFQKGDSINFAFANTDELEFGLLVTYREK